MSSAETFTQHAEGWKKENYYITLDKTFFFFNLKLLIIFLFLHENIGCSTSVRRF